MDVQRGDARQRSPGLFGAGHERSGTPRMFGLHREVVRKMLAHPVPPGYQRQSPSRCPKLEPYTGVIHAILEADAGFSCRANQRGNLV